MPNTHLTRYRWVVNDLKNLAVDLIDFAQDTQENISEVKAALAAFKLSLPGSRFQVGTCRQVPTSYTYQPENIHQTNKTGQCT